MKTFARHKTFDEVKKQCEEQGVRFDGSAYLERGYDTVVVGGPIEFVADGGRATKPRAAYAIYNTWNGKFHGVTPAGVHFNERSCQHNAKSWSKALLHFFYVEEPVDPPAPSRVEIDARSEHADWARRTARGC